MLRKFGHRPRKWLNLIDLVAVTASVGYEAASFTKYFNMVACLRGGNHCYYFNYDPSRTSIIKLDVYYTN